MIKKYGIMLIGCGHIGEEHLEDIYYRDNIQIIAVVDADAERARTFAKKFGALHFGTDYTEFLPLKEIDIVIIATYTDSHLPILKKCLENGKHVLCEKPIAKDYKSGEEFYNLVKQSKQKVLVAHILRHNLSYQKIAGMIKDGVIGKLELIRMVQNHHAMNWPRYKRLMQDCPPIVDCGVHYIDVMQWFSESPIVNVNGFGTRVDDDVDDDNFGVIYVKMANGCAGYYEAGWSKNLASQNTKEFIGDKGRITLTLKENRVSDREEGDLISLYISETGSYHTINVQSKYKDMYAQLCNLIDMIENDAPANPTIDEVFSAFKVALLANEAIEKQEHLK